MYDWHGFSERFRELCMRGAGKKMPKRKTCSRPDSLLGYLRLKKSLSIEGLADEIKVNPMLLWKMEQLRFTVQIRFAKRVADYYGLTLDELYNNDFSVLVRINPGSAVSESSYFKEQAALNVKKMSVGRRGGAFGCPVGI